MTLRKHISMIFVVLLAVAGWAAAAHAAVSASVDISPQVWRWYDGSGKSVDEHRHTRTTIGLHIPLQGRFAAEVARHSGGVITGLEGGAGFTIAGTGLTSLVAVARYQQMSINTDQTYSVHGVGYGLRAGLALFTPTLQVEYVTIPAGVAQSGSKRWDVSGDYYIVGANLLDLGLLQLRAGYVHESFTAAGQGSWTNAGAFLGAALRF